MYQRITHVIIENNDFSRSSVNAISDNTNVLRIDYFVRYEKYQSPRYDDLVALYNHVILICESSEWTIDDFEFVKVFVVDEFDKERGF